MLACMTQRPCVMRCDLAAWHTMTKCVKVLQSKSKSRKHEPITDSNLVRNGLIRACDWFMLLLLLLLCNTLTHILVLEAPGWALATKI